MAERKIGVTDVAPGAGVAEFRTRERSLGCEQYLIPTHERVPSFRGMASTYRTPGVAVANTPQLCIFNKATSGVLVAVHQLVFDHDRTTNSANQRFYAASRITTAPTDGTLLTPVAMDTVLTHNTLVEIRANGSADGTSGTFTATPGTAGWKTQGTRIPATNPPGQFIYPDNEILPNIVSERDPVVLTEGQGLLIVEADAGSTSGHVMFGVAFVEYTLP